MHSIVANKLCRIKLCSIGNDDDDVNAVILILFIPVSLIIFNASYNCIVSTLPTKIEDLLLVKVISINGHTYHRLCKAY